LATRPAGSEHFCARGAEQTSALEIKQLLFWTQFARVHSLRAPAIQAGAVAPPVLMGLRGAERQRERERVCDCLHACELRQRLNFMAVINPPHHNGALTPIDCVLVCNYAPHIFSAQWRNFLWCAAGWG